MDHEQREHQRAEIGRAICDLARAVADAVGLSVDCAPLASGQWRRDVRFHTTPTEDSAASLRLNDAVDRFATALDGSVAGGTLRDLGGTARIADARRVTPGLSVTLEVAIAAPGDRPEDT